VITKHKGSAIDDHESYGLQICIRPTSTTSGTTSSEDIESHNSFLEFVRIIDSNANHDHCEENHWELLAFHVHPFWII
jgi:hypothetical protein